MKGKYIKQNGEIVEIAEFDETNKLVLVKDGRSNNWYHEKEYSTWVAVEPEATVFVKVDPIAPEEKPKRGRKKKNE